MAKYKVSGEIESAGVPALQNGLTAELVSPLPVTVQTTLSRKIEVKEGIYLVVTDTTRYGDRIGSLLLPDEAREIAHGLLAAVGDEIPAGKPDTITDNDGDDWTLRANGTYTRVLFDGRDSPYDKDRTREWIADTYGIRSER